jgi:hypothetical protein
MKYLVTYLLAAWLAATVLARPPPPHRDAGEYPAQYMESRVANRLIAELLPGASWEADILELDPSGHVDKQSVAPPGTFGDIDATKWANYANLSAVPHVSNLAVDIGPQMANDIAPLPKEGTKLNLTVRMGGDNAYVGTLRKDRLEEAIYQCLIWSCPLNDLKRGMNACNTKNAWNPCKIDHIIYEGDDKSYRSDSGLYVWTDYVFTNPNLPGFGEAMVRFSFSKFLVHPKKNRELTKMRLFSTARQERHFAYGLMIQRAATMSTSLRRAGRRCAHAQPTSPWRSRLPVKPVTTFMVWMASKA